MSKIKSTYKLKSFYDLLIDFNKISSTSFGSITNNNNRDVLLLSSVIGHLNSMISFSDNYHGDKEKEIMRASFISYLLLLYCPDFMPNEEIFEMSNDVSEKDILVFQNGNVGSVISIVDKNIETSCLFFNDLETNQCISLADSNSIFVIGKMN